MIRCASTSTRAFFVADSDEERDAALDRRLQNRLRQLKLATSPDGTVHGGPDRATGDPQAVNVNSAIYGGPDEIARKLETLRRLGVGYVLLNGGGSGGGERGRQSLRRFAHEVMPLFPDQVSKRRRGAWRQAPEAAPPCAPPVPQQQNYDCQDQHAASRSRPNRYAFDLHQIVTNIDGYAVLNHSSLRLYRDCSTLV
jgi:hypothetical protein